MRYEITNDLLTGNILIDSEHRQLFQAVNSLMDACSAGKGCTELEPTVKFLTAYVAKHFADEENLQINSKYPGYTAHKLFHENYKKQLASATNNLLTSGSNIATLSKINMIVGTLVSHIRTEDKKLALHIKNTQKTNTLG